MIIPNNHSSLKYDKMVKLVCRNLFAKTPISFFNFARFYKSGYVLNLSTNNEWHKHYWKCNYITGAKSRLIKGINYWAGNNLMSDAAIDADKNFNISGRIEFIENYKDHIDSFSYGCPTKEKEKIINYYLNNIIELKNFNLYFLSEMQKKQLLSDCIKSGCVTDIANKHNVTRKTVYSHINTVSEAIDQ
ncbi:hypothetical protein, partial [Cysteiniphilum marinum]|uniref:hypothetical protein n=1 Tax=Cysteiniphilum marinum TaxID=2774191 RepID=UPI00193A2859